jgi:hypothetical protein
MAASSKLERERNNLEKTAGPSEYENRLIAQASLLACRSDGGRHFDKGELTDLAPPMLPSRRQTSGSSSSDCRRPATGRAPDGSAGRRYCRTGFSPIGQHAAGDGRASPNLRRPSPTSPSLPLAFGSLVAPVQQARSRQAAGQWKKMAAPGPLPSLWHLSPTSPSLPLAFGSLVAPVQQARSRQAAGQWREPAVPKWARKLLLR